MFETTSRANPTRLRRARSIANVAVDASSSPSRRHQREGGRLRSVAALLLQPVARSRFGALQRDEGQKKAPNVLKSLDAELKSAPACAPPLAARALFGQISRRPAHVAGRLRQPL